MIIAVPNGGYSSSCVLAAARQHLAERGQPDTLTVHYEFVTSAAVGPAIITVEEIKIGRTLSTLHLTLWQGKGMLDSAPWVTRSETKRCILAYATQTNFKTLSGRTTETGFKQLDEQTRPAKPDLEALLRDGKSDLWRESSPPANSVVKSNNSWRMFVPREAPFSPGVLDMWMCTRNGEMVTQAMMPYVADSFPYDMTNFIVTPEVHALLRDRTKRPVSEVQRKQAEQNKDRAGYWFPTVVLNLENKVLLPEEGIQWVNMRMTTKLMENGHFDIDVLMRDEHGAIIALSHQVSLIVSMERNMRTNKQKASL